VSLLQDIYGIGYIRYTAVKIVDHPGAAVGSTADYITLQPGERAILGVDITSDANAPYYKTLAAYQMNIEKAPQ
jgi:hypothetical protein